MTTKQFKVWKILSGPSSDGLCNYLLISPDAETWHVERSIYSLIPPAWSVGDEVEVEMRMMPCLGTNREFLCPDWWAVGAHRVVKYDLARPRDAVEIVWGPEHAMRLGDPSPASSRPALSFMFWPQDFSSSEAMNDFQKAGIANEFVSFVESNFARSKFTPTLYETLMKLYRMERVRPHKKRDFRPAVFHLAHFDSAINRKVFFSRIADSSPNDHQHEGLVDLAMALRAYVIQYVLPMVTATERHAKAMKEREQLRWLLRRHGLPDDFKLPGQR